MRLNQQQLDAIRRTLSRLLPQGTPYELRLFGSRLDDRSRGGDVDLYLETRGLDASDRFDLKLRLRPALEEALDLPVDLVVEDADEARSVVGSIARESGTVLDRVAVEEYPQRHYPENDDEAFGLWKQSPTNGVDYQDRLRSEWDE